MGVARLNGGLRLEKASAIVIMNFLAASLATLRLADWPTLATGCGSVLGKVPLHNGPGLPMPFAANAPLWILVDW
jgi:hypothetical protein